MKTTIDAPETLEGETRCQHDMLAGQCSWCRGLPDVPLEFTDWPSDRTAKPDHDARWAIASCYGICAHCQDPIRPGAKVAWSVSDAGVIGECCEDEL
jgi:hypothetical protein